MTQLAAPPRTSTLRRPLTVVLTTVSAVALRLGAQAAGYEPQAITNAGAPATPVSVASVAVVALAAGLLGWALRAVLDRRLRSSRRVWSAIAVFVLVLSLVGTLAGATSVDVAFLLALHLSVGGLVIAGIGGSVSAARQSQRRE